MKLGEFIQNYMKENDLSLRELAKRCNVSHNYIHVLIHGNTHTGKPVTPTVESYKKLATGMNMSMDALLSEIDDVPVVLKDVRLSELDPLKIEMINAFEALSEKNKQHVLDIIKTLTEMQED